MKKLVNPKLAQEKITIVEDSSSQEDLEELESLNDRKVKGKKQVSLKVNSSSTEIIPHLGGNGPPFPSSWEHLSLGWGSNGLEKWK